VPEDVSITTGRMTDPQMTSALIDGMFRLRHAIFHQRFGWDVASKDGREQDEFDECNPVYVVASEARTHRVVGCCRLLPTTGPYMLSHVFPQALRGAEAPVSPRLWEISRLATAKGWRMTGQAGLGALAAALVTRAAQAIEDHGGDTIVALSSAGLERMARQHVPTTRLDGGQWTQIGTVRCAAFTCPTAPWLTASLPPYPGLTNK
jgi:acyl homoserine lactone synthase